MMNKFFILLLSACCLLTTACDKENDETVQGFRIMKADVDLVVPHLPVHDYAASPSTGRVY